MDTSVSCPVCTLYLREGVSLQNHLNTHPKDQVIEALLKYCTVRDGSSENDVGCVLAAQYANHQNSSCVTDSPVHLSSQQYPCGSSHFTAAVTYQQFMSSNASVGGSLFPQCFSVPAIITTTSGEIGPATLMPLLYNPYVIQQQQQQQLQFYNTFRTIPQQPLTRQILPPSALFPISPPFSVSACGNAVLQNNLSVSSSATSALQNGENVQSTSSIFLPSITNVCQESTTKYVEKDQTEGSSLPVLLKYKDNGDGKQISARHVVHCSEVPENEECVLEQTIPTSKETATVVCEEELNSPTTISLFSGAKSCSNAEANINDNHHKKVPDYCNKMCGSEDNLEDNFPACMGDSQYSPVSPSLRVRTDLSKISPDTDSVIEDNKSNDMGGTCVETVADGRMSVNKCVTDVEWKFLSDAEKHSSEMCTSDNIEKESPEYITSDIYPGRTSCDTESTTCRNQQLSPITCRDSVAAVDARHFEVVDIEGIHVLVPSHFLSTERGLTTSNGHEPVLRTSRQQCRFREQSSDGDADISVVTNQDIQTDEVMPPMGELSGQESLGENDAISWSQEKEDLSTSYDLLAREKWEASEGSDEDNDGDTAVRPVTSKLQLSLCSTVPSVNPSEEEKKMKKKKKKKKKEKLKCIYKCWTCDQIFTCPKERRVHQSEKHSTQTCVGRIKRRKETIENIWHSEHSPDNQQNGTVKEESEEDKMCIKSETGMLPDVSDKIEESKPVSEVTSKSFDDHCLKDIKNLEEQSKEEENAFKFICSRCETVFTSAKSLHRHVRTTHGLSQFTCRTCSEKFPSEAVYLAHLKVHPLECSRCGKYFYRHQNLNLHIRRHLGIKPFKCSICDKSFVTKQKLAEHTNTHTGNTPIKCNLCTETFRRYSNLIQHKNRHHLKLKKKVKDFICQCGEIFHSQKKLQWHKEIHDEKPKTCNYCSERFVHASSLTRHIRKAHDQRYFPCQGRESENVECPVCGCVFLKSSLPVHMRLHSGERPFNCHICGKNFSTKWNLQLHRWTHASRSLKPYKCSLCKSAFIRHSEYTSHMHSHRNVRPYTCNYCGSQFIRKYNCIRHAREHEGEKPFSCNICQKAFHRRYYLKEHMRIHSGARPFACHICGKTSSTKSNHNKHVKIHHAREAINTEG